MITMSCRIAGGDYDCGGVATRMLKDHLTRIGVEAQALRRAMIAAYEAEMNVVIHAHTGSMWARLDDGRLDLEVSDEGPGISDVELAMQEGWSTASEKARQMGFGAGLGLPNIRRNSDLFEIESRVGKGTRIRSTIFLRRGVDDRVASPRSTGLSLERGRCRSCLRCLFACPTGALRARDGGPLLLENLCVGCTACIAECPDRVFGIRDEEAAADRPAAGAAAADGAVLVLPSGFLSGFPGAPSPDRVLGALARLGFTDVRLTEEWEGSLRAAAREAAGASPRHLPVIPPVCPAVVNLIEMQFPSLIPNLAPYLSPVEAAGGDFPLRPVVLVAACPSQYAAAIRSSHTERLTVVSPARLARELLPLVATMKGQERQPNGEGTRRAGTSDEGACGAESAGRAVGAGCAVLRVTGMRHVQKILSEVETGALEGVSVLECFACDQGCVGSPLLGSNPFIAARHRDEAGLRSARERFDAVRRARPFAARPGMRLDDDMGEAIRKLARIDALARTLAGRDCGSCGAPSCAAFAEDVVIGRAGEAACPYPRRTEEQT
jgi:anti-sigma regulatory factor (Ser/Thr protein kinase)/Na+-translocating ferredoxin:NAD+ oxidoreductase RNF subunit RnfB